MKTIQYFICPNKFQHSVLESDNGYHFHITTNDEIVKSIDNITRHEAVNHLMDCFKQHIDKI